MGSPSFKFKSLTSKLTRKNTVYLSLFFVVFVLCLVLTIILKLSWLSFVSAIFGILYMVFLSERSVFNFLIGLVSTLTYTIITYNVHLYGETIFYLTFDLPMILISFLFWKNHLENNKVKPREISTRNKVILLVSSLVIIYLYSLFLNLIGGEFVLIDAASSITTIIATILMSQRFREQWFMWVVVYVISIIMWISVFDILMLIMSICCFISSLVGYINWRTGKATE